MNKQMLKAEWEKIVGHSIRNDIYILLERMSNNEIYNDIIEDIEKDRSKYDIKDSYILTKEKTIREYLSLIKLPQQKEQQVIKREVPRKYKVIKKKIPRTSGTSALVDRGDKSESIEENPFLQESINSDTTYPR